MSHQIRRTAGILFLLIIVSLVSPPARAVSLVELSTAVEDYFVAGAITNVEVKAALSALVYKAMAAPDPEAQSIYLTSFRDLVTAYSGAGIDSAAASELTRLAR